MIQFIYANKQGHNSEERFINSKTLFSNNDLIFTNLFYGTFYTTKLLS